MSTEPTPIPQTPGDGLHVVVQDGVRVTDPFASLAEAQEAADKLRKKAPLQDSQGNAAPAPQIVRTING